ncbi:nucleotide pyrophosphohydrolase [Mycoplasma sp. ES3157-GEN-MYC]|uniref:Nucleotide pyrophosphohydrolase n=1 Tax=Mycoplasma miroungigenitalium TaxID=754515 RepID=A0A6M4J8L1_9MOLU|nr:MazG nucleotide pyrophosphohydrolase domain-containing protein [Mycoplasma miroungigenitalium]MBU4690242.1 nucleotide pyrophosphohydrolase [Mycoplasma miroungigenitalium]MBU4691509.1 nucleotide pyrophosphohydrolase [Mycoplasma miroungigenitalium]QJR43343.1 nucleotide pyrophosphohydrolase [Mycoplasma miroungigenitalium]
MENLDFKDLQNYLKQHYQDKFKDPNFLFRMFIKLTEEIGEVAEVINIKNNYKKATKKNDGSDESLIVELGDMLHYIFAIAAYTNIDLAKSVINKDVEAAKKYNHTTNLKEYIELNK